MASFQRIFAIFSLCFCCQLLCTYGFTNPQLGSVNSRKGSNRNPIVFQTNEDETTPDQDTAVSPGSFKMPLLPWGAQNPKSPEIIGSTLPPQLSSSPRSLESEEKTRVRLCPKTPSDEYRYDIKAKKCSKIGTQSHCGKNMIFYSYDVSKVYGRCDCDYSATIPLVFHPKTNRCYYVYQQAYCGKNEWLELNKNAEPICSENKCYDFGRTSFGQKPLASRDIAPEYVPYKGNGECVKINQASKSCNDSQVIMFRLPRQFYPSCSNPKLQFRLVSITGTLKCAPGTYMSIVGTCQPDFDFDFD